MSGEWQGPFRRDELPQVAQTAIAASEGHQILTRIGEFRGGTRHETRGPLPGILAEWQHELANRLTEGSTTTCEHLSLARPEPMMWLVYVPEVLGCARCAGEAAMAVTGTPADNVCDGCGATDPVSHVVAGEIPAGLLKLDGPEIGLGPIIIQGGLCPPCAHINEAISRKASRRADRIEPRDRP